MIKLQNVSKQYRGIPEEKHNGIYLWIKNIISLTSNRAASVMAVNDVSFSVDRGEIFGIYGANGAGKTTLIKMLSGLLEPSGGKVEINGNSDNRYIKDSVSYISTNGWMGLEWQLTARENLVLYGAIFGIRGKKLELKCDEVLDTLGMTEASNKYISQLSAGMRQKITIARGLVLDRPVIFYDEPSVSLDVQSAKNLREYISKDASENGRTVIIASHNAADMAVCGRIMLLSKGQAVKTGTWNELGMPLSGTRFIGVNCLSPEQDFHPEKLPGVMDVVISPADGRDNEIAVKIKTQKRDFSLDSLIDYFIENRIMVLGIKPQETTIQEIYEYYLAQEVRADHAVS